MSGVITVVVSLFFVNLIRVGLRAFQQLNVGSHRRLPVIPVSYGMTAMDYFNIVGVGYVGLQSWSFALLAILVSGTGAWIGSWAAMYLHRRIFG